jgi:hypothetical protein
MEDLPLTRLRRYGFTPYFGEDKQFLMMPPEFELVLACESRYVVLVIYEVLRQSVGYAGDGEHGGRVERTPPVCRSALYSLFLPPFGSGSVTVFDPAPLCASPSQKPACGFPAQASSDGH